MTSNTQNAPATIPTIESLFVQNEKVWASSEDVARIFGKQHRNVLQAIDNLEVSEDFRRLNFQQTEQMRPSPLVKGAQISSRMINMTRDGFALLVMGFTGKKAMQFKIAYIEAFNRMEEELKRKAFAGMKDRLEIQFGDARKEFDSERRWLEHRQKEIDAEKANIERSWAAYQAAERRQENRRVALRKAEKELEAARAALPAPAETTVPALPDWSTAKGPRVRFLGHLDDEGRLHLAQLEDNACVFSPEQLPRLVCDSSFLMNRDKESRQKLLGELAAAAALRAQFGASVAQEKLYRNGTARKN